MYDCYQLFCWQLPLAVPTRAPLYQALHGEVGQSRCTKELAAIMTVNQSKRVKPMSRWGRGGERTRMQYYEHGAYSLVAGTESFPKSLLLCSLPNVILAPSLPPNHHDTNLLLKACWMHIPGASLMAVKLAQGFGACSPLDSANETRSHLAQIRCLP